VQFVCRIGTPDGRVLEEIYQDARQEGRQEGITALRELVLTQAEAKFGPLPPETRQRIQSAPLDMLQTWGRRLVHAASLDQIFG